MDRKTSLLETCAALIRDPVGLGRDEPLRALHDHGPVLLAITVASAAVFGGVVGTYRGGVQLLYAALKLPLLWVVPVLVTLPAVRALYRVCGVVVSYAQASLAVLIGCARSALLLAVASPALWLMFSVEVDYHWAVLVLCGSLLGSGVVGLATLARVLPGSGPGKMVGSALAALAVGVVVAQSGWILRPFVARPRADVAFLRPIESDVFSSTLASWRSARGNYEGWDARPEGLLAEPPEPSEARP
ncbi:MAG: hypothetical protein ACRBN8_23930 [Nannocystales bacterium]